MALKEDIERFVPFNEQETRDKELILWCLENEKNIFTRENVVAHMSASAWVLNPDHSKALMAFHNIYQSWSWLGGHADGDEDLLHVAIKEVKEESGLSVVRPISSDIFSLEVLTVDGHIKHGHYVSSHLHLNVTYLLEADDKEPIRCKPDENSGVRWYSQIGAKEASSEPWMKERIYQKLIDKTAIFFKK